jgi:hypothetical protein
MKKFIHRLFVLARFIELEEFIWKLWPVIKMSVNFFTSKLFVPTPLGSKLKPVSAMEQAPFSGHVATNVFFFSFLFLVKFFSNLLHCGNKNFEIFFEFFFGKNRLKTPLKLRENKLSGRL